MNNLQELIKMALDVRSGYAEYEKKTGGKMWDNRDIMDGFVVDVADLLKLIMSKDGLRSETSVDEKIAHELSDCLYCIFVLSNKYNVDIEKEYIKNMKMLKERIVSQTKSMH